MRNAPVQNAADGAAVRHHDRDDLQGDDGVERNGRADVDERDEAREDACEGDGVGGDLHLGMDVPDPL